MVQVPKSKQLSLERFCKSKGIHATKVIKDVKRMIDKNLKQMASIHERFDYNRYNRYDAVSRFILKGRNYQMDLKWREIFVDLIFADLNLTFLGLNFRN